MKNYDIIIIGAGPAGMSAAIYLQRSNLKIALVERNAPGGRMLQAAYITNYAGLKGSGADIAEAMFSMIDFSKIDFILDEVVSVKKEEQFIVQTKQDVLTSTNVILASGFVNKPLPNTDEEKFIGRGISYCALCDAPLVKGKTVLCLANDILDEPTTGLHTHDISKLINVLDALIDGGGTVLVIEHNLDVIKVADYIIDLGPDGGNKGGEIVTTGTPEEVAQCEKSYTGQFLKKVLGEQHES